MAEERPRKRRTAATQPRKTVKASIVLDVQTHARLAAAAALRGMDRSALAAEFITEGLKGLVIVNRGKFADNVDSDSPGRSTDAA